MTETCKIDGCEGKKYVRGWCKQHYDRWHRHGDPTILKHRPPGTLCSVDGCDKKHHSKGYCSKHYSRLTRHGDLNITLRNSPGLGTIRAGYRIHSVNKKRVREHIIIAEDAIGSSLPNGAVVHHHNGVRDDNRNENLVVCESSAYHMLLHLRSRALRACGNVTWRRCGCCGLHDDPKNMMFVKTKNTGSFYHPACKSKYNKEHNKEYNKRRRNEK